MHFQCSERLEESSRGATLYFVLAVLDRLLTEQSNPATRDLDVLSTVALLGVLNSEDKKIAAAVEAELPHVARALDGIHERVSGGGRLFYLGAGTSGRLGVLDASECPPTFGVSPELVQGVIAGGEAALTCSIEGAEDDPEAGFAELRRRGFSAQDAALGLSASGRTPYVVAAIRRARELGALTVGVSCTPDSELARAAEVAITPLVGPEAVTGSTRMKAGTAQKLVLNMLSTGLMVKLGYVYGNRMIRVRPVNDKLLDRATRMVAELSGRTYEEAGQALEQAEGDVRRAIVAARFVLGPAEAAERLEAAGDNLRAALDEAPR